ncbi:MAG: glutathione S-transferase family protein [Kofleriaceae bacterium]|nr:glutathione S-transferase family protein [Kofleriaceae bacterium]
MKLYNVDASPNCFRVRAVINELDLSVELIDVNLRARSEEFLAVSPGGKVPGFVDDDGFTLFESRAINNYLASKAPARGLYPDDYKRRAIVDQWSYWHAIHLGPAVNALTFERVGKVAWGMGTPDEAVITAKLAEIAQFLPVLERGLAGKTWLAGSLTTADFAVASTFVARRQANIPLDNFPNVTAWLERIEALPSWKAALPKYLSK